jgi:hypothetical protein
MVALFKTGRGLTKAVVDVSSLLECAPLAAGGRNATVSPTITSPATT